jgi:hypothetical protein
VASLNIAAYPSSLNAAIGRSVTEDLPPHPVDSMDLDEPQVRPYATPAGATLLARQFESAVSAGMSSGRFGDYEDVRAAGERATSRGAYGQAWPAAPLAQTTLFGPWRRRLEWLRNHVANGTERVVALALMLSHNNLFTHKALAKLGACLLRLDGWRTGVQVDTAALIRLIRGSTTLFHALARISVTPYLEAVTGDFGVVAEFFHGTVFTNRKSIDIMNTAVLRRFRGGKHVDLIEDPAQLDAPSDESPSVLIMADSENAGRIEYPRDLFNQPFYYSRSSKAPVMWQKHQYADFAAYVLGKTRSNDLASMYSRKAHYWATVPRVTVASRAFATYADATGSMTVQVPGTGTTGIAEFNTSDAWQAYNGKNTPPVAMARFFAGAQ